MAQDPYGYGATARAIPSPAGFGSREASKAMWLGVAASALTSVGLCLMYLPYLAACPLGGYALWRSYQVAQTLAPDDRDGRAMVNAGMLTGGVSFVVSGLFCLFWALYLAFVVVYIAIAVLVVGIGAATGGGS